LRNSHFGDIGAMRQIWRIQVDLRIKLTETLGQYVKMSLSNLKSLHSIYQPHNPFHTTSHPTPPSRYEIRFSDVGAFHHELVMIDCVHLA